MATRQAEGHDLAGRCRRVGWPVRKVLNGWRVTCPDGTPVVIHLTPSDRNTHKMTLKVLNEHGLDRAETELAEREEADRRTRLATDRETNERKTRLVQERASALARAAGPYTPAQITVDQVLAEHPVPIIFGRVLVTQEMAQALLERNEPTGKAPWPMRPIRPADVELWKARLRSGRFRYTHQGVAFDVDGRLQDGQHRLTAIAETGIAGEMMISAGWPTENYSVHDTGRRRTAGQALHHAGASYASTAASAVRLIYLFGLWRTAALDHASDRIDNDLIEETWAKLNTDDLAWAVRAAHDLRRQIGCAPTGPVAALYVIRSQVSLTEPDPVLAFVDGLVRGVNPDTEDPIYVLRRQLTRLATGMVRKLTAAEQMALIIKGWNAFAQGRRIQTLMIRTDSPMPMVFIPPPRPKREPEEPTGPEET